MRSSLIVFLLGAMLLTGCGGAASASAPGDPAKGKALFEQEDIRGAPGCITCHSVQPGEEVYGPSLAGVARRAAELSMDGSPETYLRQSILEPDAYVVAGFPAGEMYPDFGRDLSKAELKDLVAYLSQLK